MFVLNNLYLIIYNIILNVNNYLNMFRIIKKLKIVMFMNYNKIVYCVKNVEKIFTYKIINVYNNVMVVYIKLKFSKII